MTFMKVLMTLLTKSHDLPSNNVPSKGLMEFYNSVPFNGIMGF